MRSLRIPALLAALTLSAAPALAEDWQVLKDTSVHSSRPQTLDVNLILNPFFGYSDYGVAGWYGYPIMPDGFVPAINDALYIEGGAGLAYFKTNFGLGSCDLSWWAITPMAGARYQVYLTSDWTVFAIAKLGYRIGFGGSDTCNGVSVGSSVNYSAVAFDSGVGAYYKINDTWTLRLDMGYFGFQAGVGVPGFHQ
jgi:hypothetical protein